MLRLPRFSVVAPDSVEAATAALAEPGAKIVAGGTDILPNLKHRFSTPPKLVSLAKLSSLRDIVVSDGELRLGAAATLTEVSSHADVLQHFPSLAKAAGLVASPLIRNLGTIGGNVNLDTRCRYVNQTEFWREAIGGCLKSNGDVCHVVKGGKSCVAAMSSDCVPVLITLDAYVVLAGVNGRRQVLLGDYFNTDGIAHINRDPGELTVEIVIPLPQTARRTTYSKWTVRHSIDFPLVSVALRFDLADDRDDAPITAAKACIGVLAARPKVVDLKSVVGRNLAEPETARAVAETIHKRGKPLPNVPYDAPYRRKMLPVYTRRSIEALVGGS